jgi:hypothetical protein
VLLQLHIMLNQQIDNACVLPVDNSMHTRGRCHSMHNVIAGPGQQPGDRLIHNGQAMLLLRVPSLYFLGTIQLAPGSAESSELRHGCLQLPHPGLCSRSC